MFILFLRTDRTSTSFNAHAAPVPFHPCFDCLWHAICLSFCNWRYHGRFALKLTLPGFPSSTRLCALDTLLCQSPILSFRGAKWDGSFSVGPLLV